MLKLPPFFFPTRILILDDDKHFLNLLHRLLEDDFNVEVSSNADEFFAQLAQDNLQASASNAHLTNAEKVKNFIEMGESQQVVSVVVTDYHLEGMIGLDVLKKIESPAIQRVLMSNFVDEQIIHSAFNERVIDAFLPKFDRNFIQALRSCIADFQRQFFVKYCLHFYDVALQKSKLCDPLFVDYVEEIIRKHSISQMIVNDDQNIFEMQSNETAQKIDLQVALDEDLEDFINSLQGEQAPKAVLNRIEQKLAMPCFPNGMLLDGSLWAEYMKPINRLQGEKPYYISCFTKDDGISLPA